MILKAAAPLRVHILSLISAHAWQYGPAALVQVYFVFAFSEWLTGSPEQLLGSQHHQTSTRVPQGYQD